MKSLFVFVSVVAHVAVPDNWDATPERTFNWCPGHEIHRATYFCPIAPVI